MGLRDKRILITQNRLLDYTGSEVAVLELAEFLSRAGAEVLVATYAYDYPIKKDFLELPSVQVFELPDARLEAELNRRSPDYAWIHHQIIPSCLLTPAVDKDIIFIFHHMSYFHPLEFPIFWRIETELASKIIFNAEEVREKILATGILQSVSDKKCAIFGNPAPQAYTAVDRENTRALSQILIVSNHIPPEVREAAAKLKEKGIGVVIAGVENKSKREYRRIMPSDLQNIQAVIAIGKTVQYCLVAGVPVYCYDHFGGPGYLKESNYKKAKKHNFSGRGFSSKSVEEIVAEITGNYRKALEYAAQLRRIASEEFILDAKVTNLIASIKKPIGSHTTHALGVDARDLTGYIKYQQILDEMYKLQKAHNTLTLQLSTTVLERPSESNQKDRAENDRARSPYILEGLNKIKKKLFKFPKDRH